MQRTKVTTLLLVTVATTLIGWFVVVGLERRGTYLPHVPWIVDVALVALAAGVFWAGWAVRSYLKGRRPSLDPLRAARTLVLAKAAALTGSLLAGWYLAQVVAVLGDLAIEARRDRAIAVGSRRCAPWCSPSSGSSWRSSARSRPTTPTPRTADGRVPTARPIPRPVPRPDARSVFRPTRRPCPDGKMGT